MIEFPSRVSLPNTLVKDVPPNKPLIEFPESLFAINTAALTFIVCDAVLVFVQKSLAVQVLVTEYEPSQFGTVATSSKVKVTSLHVSVAIACWKTGVEL